MKVFFTDNCFWDDEKKNIFRNGEKVKITPSQRKLVAKLIRCNGRMVSHEELYYEMTGEEPYGEYKTSLSNQFTRNKSNEKGLLIRVPEINKYFEMSKSLVSGGYMIKVPTENCIENVKEVPKGRLDGMNIWYTTEDISLWSKQGNSNESYRVSKLMKTYLQGGRCTWPILFSPDGNCPVRRDIIDDLLELIECESGAIVLTGAGGEGKTTILMQLCIELYKMNKRILFHAPTYKYDLPTSFFVDVIIVDNPSNTREFKNFLSTAITTGQTVVIAARSNEWNILKDNLYDDIKRSIKEIEIPRISLKEAEEFALCVKRNLPTVRRSEKELKNLFYKDSYGFLYASMLMAVYNCESLEEITYQMIEKIAQYEKSSPSLKVLAAIVFAEKNKMSVNNKQYKMLCKKLDIDGREPKYYLKMEISVNGSLYQSRHKSISNLFYKYLYTEGNWKNYLCDEEIEMIICALTDCYLDEVETLNRDLNPKDLRVISISDFLIGALTYKQDEEYLCYILQRVIEACQQHGYAIIARTFHGSRNHDVKIKIGKLCYEKQLPVWEVYSHWINELAENEVNIEEVREYIKNICMWPDVPNSLWILWGRIEENMGNIGTCEIEYTATWIFYKACTRRLQDGNIWIAYIKFIKRHFPECNESYELSVGNILKTACLDYGCRNQIWSEWADYEEEKGNIGDYNTIGSAAWIHRESCEKALNISDGMGWIKWARFAKKYNDECCDFSADSILERACLLMNAGTSVWNEWAKEEISLGNIGNYSTIGSAAWILMEACINHNETGDPVLWENWIAFVRGYPDIENSPSVVDIYRMACIEQGVRNSHIWVHWANEEVNIGNVGDYDIVGSAAWIYKVGAEQALDQDNEIWIEWARFVKEHNFCTGKNEKYSPANILKVGCLEYSAHAPVWSAWARYVEENGEVGNYETPFTAAWILKEGCTKYNTTGDTNSVLRWAEFAHRYPMYSANGEYINAEYILRMAYKKYSGFRNQAWIDLRNFKEKIGYIEE